MLVCRVLTEHGCRIARRTFCAWLARSPSARALWDTVITAALAGYHESDEHRCRKPESLYGAAKMWALACGAFGCAAFGVDAYAGRIMGWACAAGTEYRFGCQGQANRAPRDSPALPANTRATVTVVGHGGCP